MDRFFIIGISALILLVCSSPAHAQQKKQKPNKAAVAAPPASIVGTIAAVCESGKSVTITLQGGTKKQPAGTSEVKLTEQTKYLYLGIEDKAEQKLKPGLSVMVMLDDKEKDTAAGMLVSKAHDLPRKKKKDK